MAIVVPKRVILDPRTASIKARVAECYNNLQRADMKFTDDMVILAKLDLIDHFDCTLKQLKDRKDLSPVTQRYLKECKHLKDFNPMNVRENLQKIGLI